MSKNTFEIKILNFHWIKEDDGQDLCLHGNVFVKIGDEIIIDANTLDVTLSSAALHLMRALKQNYKPDDYSSQLFPHCGHFIIADDEKDCVDILGCPTGIDWTIVHLKDNKVKLITESGQEIIIEEKLFQKIVLDFADQVENFYKSSIPRIIPTDEFEKMGYLTFWKEWRYLREEWK